MGPRRSPRPKNPFEDLFFDVDDDVACVVVGGDDNDDIASVDLVPSSFDSETVGRSSTSVEVALLLLPPLRPSSLEDEAATGRSETKRRLLFFCRRAMRGDDDDNAIVDTVALAGTRHCGAPPTAAAAAEGGVRARIMSERKRRHAKKARKDREREWNTRTKSFSLFFFDKKNGRTTDFFLSKI